MTLAVRAVASPSANSTSERQVLRTGLSWAHPMIFHSESCLWLTTAPSKGLTMQKHDGGMDIIVSGFQGHFCIEGRESLIFQVIIEVGFKTRNVSEANFLRLSSSQFDPYQSSTIHNKPFIWSCLAGSASVSGVSGLYVLHWPISPIGVRIFAVISVPVLMDEHCQVLAGLNKGDDSGLEFNPFILSKLT